MKQSMNVRGPAWLGISMCMLAACSNQTTSPTPAVVPSATPAVQYSLAQAYAKFQAKPHHFDMQKGFFLGKSVHMVIDYVPGPRGKFTGITASTVNVHTQIRLNNRIIADSSNIEYNAVDDDRPLGSIGVKPPSFVKVTTFMGYPTAVKVGDTGVFEERTYYNDAKMTTVRAHTNLHYAIRNDPDPGHDPVACLSEDKGIANMSLAICYHVDPANSFYSPMVIARQKNRELILR